MAKQVTTATIREMKQNGTPITMVTAYDYSMAKNVNEAGVDMILVGDSLGNVMLGYNSTVSITAIFSSITAYELYAIPFGTTY